MAIRSRETEMLGRPERIGPAVAGLNPAQSQAVETLEGPLLVIAGAGTGKTHTLVHRLVRLVGSGVAPENILLLTFTRRAAAEMIRRASALLEGGCDPVSGGTFHSFAHLMLRRHGRAIELDRDFAILDQADSFEVLSGIRSELKLAERGRGFPRRETIAAVLSKAVNKQAPIEEILAEEYPQFLGELAELTRIAGLYEAYKRRRKLVDFDDLLLYLIRLFQDAPAAAARIRHRYRYIMVDEYQDTNVLQARITLLLAGENGNVMVVGDDAQSIYAFRGACHRNLFEFHRAFPTARLVKLEQNYRSTQPILDLANALMAQMSQAFHKRLFTEREEGARPRLIEAPDEMEQAAFVADEVEELARRGAPLSEVAVLFRAGRHSFALELELQHRQVPYVKYGGFRFHESAHIRDVVAHLRLIAQPEDDLAFTRVLLLREGIGRAGARRARQSVSERGLVEGLRRHAAKGRARRSLDEIAALLEDLLKSGGSPASLLERVMEDYVPLMKLRFDDWPRRRRDLEVLVDLCRRYRSLSSMLSDLALDPPSSSSRDNLAARSAEDQLVLSTLHSAKGLEWRRVYIIQARDGYLPMLSGFREDEAEELDEELRLLYVGVTRAKDELCIVWPRETASGRYSIPAVSRFLAPVPRRVLPRLRTSEAGTAGQSQDPFL